MEDCTRRHFVRVSVCGVTSLTLGSLLPACGQPTGILTASSQRGAAPVATRAYGLTRTPLAETTASATRLPVSSPLVATATAIPVNQSVLFGKDCQTAIGEGVALSFREKVQRYSDLVFVGTVREILPARWNTPDGHRPENPNALHIITPVRVEIERIAKGSYAQHDLYFAVFGGRIGLDCVGQGGSGPRPSFDLGQRFLYFAEYSTSQNPGPVPEDARYRYFSAVDSYVVTPDDRITIRTENDIMGNVVDKPERTLPIDEVFREIAAILAQPSPTPRR
jgi:hypothetical protein